MSECPRCGLKFSLPQAQCPSCEQSLTNVETSGAGGLVTGYFRKVWRIHVSPVAFFSELPLRGGLAGPLAFALVTHWLGSSMAFVWRTLLGGELSDFFGKMSGLLGEIAQVPDVDSPGRVAGWGTVQEAQDWFTRWFWGAGSVIVDPFWTLASVLFVSLLIYTGARILVTPGKDGSPREITYESAVRLVCYGMAPSLLAGVPLVGRGIAFLYTAFVTVAGARAIYRVGTLRAIAIALFPQLLELVAILTAVSVAVLLFARLVATMF